MQKNGSKSAIFHTFLAVFLKKKNDGGYEHVYRDDNNNNNNLPTTNVNSMTTIHLHSCAPGNKVSIVRHDSMVREDVSGSGWNNENLNVKSKLGIREPVCRLESAENHYT